MTYSRSSCSKFSFLLATLLVLSHFAGAQDFKKQVIYQIVTDRFLQRTTSNDNPSQSSGLFDSTKTNWQAYWGGDLAGIQQKMSYLKGMGVTAIWISPTVDNENLNMRHRQSDLGPLSRIRRARLHEGRRALRRYQQLAGPPSTMVSAAHSNGIKIIVDWANNHSNYNGGGEFGALYNNGVFMASDSNDPNGYFHHNPNIADYNDRYQLQYYTLLSLEDLNQENATIDSYLKTAVASIPVPRRRRLPPRRHQARDLGLGILLRQLRLQSGAELPLRRVVQQQFRRRACITTPTSSRTRPGSTNSTSASIRRCAMCLPATTTSLSSTARSTTENSNFTWNNDLVTFFDSHDESRLLTVNNNNNRLHEAMAFRADRTRHPGHSLRRRAVLCTTTRTAGAILTAASG